MHRGATRYMVKYLCRSFKNFLFFLICIFLDSKDNNVLLIALAGIHQIWAYFLKDGEWLKGK